MLRILFMISAILLGGAFQANAFGNLQELEELGQVFGVARICMQKAGVKLENPKEVENLILQICLPYKKDYGVDAPRTFGNGIKNGIAIANSADASQCREFLGYVVSLVRALGADVSSWQKAYSYYTKRSRKGTKKGK